MKKKLRYLVTGGTGFLGQFVLRALESKAEVDVLSRSGKTGIKGDLTRWHGDLDLESLKEKNYDVMLHLAGLYDLNASESDVYIHNIAGTNTALQIATALKVPIFINASSIAAASNQMTEAVSPYDLNFLKKFPDFYSESKARGEQLVQNWLGPTTLRINLRLGILVGDTKDGKILRLDGPYHVADSLERVKSWLTVWNWVLPVPGNPGVTLPLVPVDEAAQAVADISLWATQSNEVGYRSFHVVPKMGVSVEHLYRSTFHHLGLGHIRFKFIEQIPRNLFTKLGAVAFNLPEEQLRYAYRLPKFESESTRTVLGEDWCSEFESYENAFWSGYDKYLSHR